MATTNFSMLPKSTTFIYRIHMLEYTGETGQATDAMRVYASEAGAGGSSKKEDPMEEKKKGKDTPVDQAGRENKSPNSKNQPSDKSITDQDSDLTGDTGNLNKGQTDLGASGTGSEDV